MKNTEKKVNKWKAHFLMYKLMWYIKQIDKIEKEKAQKLKQTNKKSS